MAATSPRRQLCMKNAASRSPQRIFILAATPERCSIGQMHDTARDSMQRSTAETEKCGTTSPDFRRPARHALQSPHCAASPDASPRPIKTVSRFSLELSPTASTPWLTRGPSAPTKVALAPKIYLPPTTYLPRTRHPSSELRVMPYCAPLHLG